KRGTQQMRDAATGGKGGGDRQSDSDAIHGWSSRFVVFCPRNLHRETRLRQRDQRPRAME
ncbi:MAG TPA: hypothetical protein VGO01_22135, partial [Bradyrhizobium sp.]|nr:hypothetical protein [Bradyrhizobium sp.]